MRVCVCVGGCGQIAPVMMTIVSSKGQRDNGRGLPLRYILRTKRKEGKKEQKKKESKYSNFIIKMFTKEY
jgi:hypothetical protein